MKFSDQNPARYSSQERKLPEIEQAPSGSKMAGSEAKSRGIVICEFCHKSGHSVERCYAKQRAERKRTASIFNEKYESETDSSSERVENADEFTEQSEVKTDIGSFKTLAVQKAVEQLADSPTVQFLSMVNNTKPWWIQARRFLWFRFTYSKIRMMQSYPKHA